MTAPLNLDAMMTFVQEYMHRNALAPCEERIAWRQNPTVRWKHTLRVLAMAQKIARAEQADWDVVTVATIFHDVAKLNSEWNEHASRGAGIARAYLISCGLEMGWIDRVCRAIIHHPARHTVPANELVLEVCVLRDADYLDEMGALGIIWTTMSTGIEQLSYDLVREQIVKRDLLYTKQAIEHMTTATGRKIAQQRLEFVKNFVAQLDDELGTVGG